MSLKPICDLHFHLQPFSSPFSSLFPVLISFCFDFHSFIKKVKGWVNGKTPLKLSDHVFDSRFTKAHIIKVLKNNYPGLVVDEKNFTIATASMKHYFLGGMLQQTFDEFWVCLNLYCCFIFKFRRPFTTLRFLFLFCSQSTRVRRRNLKK